MHSSVTVCLVPEARGGPFVFWDDLAESCKQAANLGFDAIELYPSSPESIDVAGLRRVLSDNRLQLSALASGAGFVAHGLTLSSEEAEIRERASRFVAALIDLGAEFGAPVIIGSMKGSLREGNSASTVSRLVDSLQQLCDHAGRRGTYVLLEATNRYETRLINRLAEGVELIRTFKLRAKILADLFHMNIEEESICAALQEAAGDLGYVHFVDSNRHPPGQGHLGLCGIISALKTMGYDGYLSAEVLPYPDSIAAASLTISAFRHLVEGEPERRSLGEMP